MSHYRYTIRFAPGVYIRGGLVTFVLAGIVWFLWAAVKFTAVSLVILATLIYQGVRQCRKIRAEKRASSRGSSSFSSASSPGSSPH